MVRNMGNPFEQNENSMFAQNNQAGMANTAYNSFFCKDADQQGHGQNAMSGTGASGFFRQ